MQLTHPSSRKLANGPAALNDQSNKRFGVAFACLGTAYVLSWIELWLSMRLVVPDSGTANSLAGSLASRLLVGVLLLSLARGYGWARWLAVALGVCSTVVTAPFVPAEWSVFPAAGAVTAAILIFKLASAALLALLALPQHHH